MPGHFYNLLRGHKTCKIYLLKNAKTLIFFSMKPIQIYAIWNLAKETN